MTVYKCSCDKILEEVDDGKTEKRVIQKNLACRECRKNHACCVAYSIEHAVDFLRAIGFTVEAPK